VACRAALLVGVSATSIVSSIGCSTSDGRSHAGASSGSEAVGTVGMSLTLPGGASLTSIQWVVTATGSVTVQQGTVPIGASTSIQFVVSNLPAGGGYTITIDGTSTDGSVTCVGSAQFAIAARQTTLVTDFLQCSPATADAGSAHVTAPTFNCGVLDSIAASPSEITVGSSVDLTAVAAGVDPTALTYAWSAPSGSFGAPSATNTSYTCTAPGVVTLTVAVGDGPVPSGASCNASLSTGTIQITCDAALDAGAAGDATVGSDAATADTGAPVQALLTTLDPGVLPTAVAINQGTAIGEGPLNGATPSMLSNLAADPNNTQSIATNDGGPPFLASGNVPDPAAGFCDYPADGGAPVRASYVTGAKFESAADASTSDPMVGLAPAYFPLVYTTTNTPTPNAFGGQPPIIGLFDWRPKDIDEALLVAESDDNGKTWFFMQNVLELNPDFTNPISGGFSPSSTNTGCPTTVHSTNADFVGATGSQADDGWGHASIVQLPGPGNVKTGQFLYLLDRNTNDIPGTSDSIVDNAPLHAINITGSSNKFPIWNTNNTSPGNNDIKSIASALDNTAGAADAGNAVVVQDTVGLLNPDGIMAVFPMPATTPAGTAVTVLYVQKILNGDDTGPTAMPTAQQCTKAPFSGKTNHDISNVRVATTVDGVHFVDEGVVEGLNDTTTVDYTKTRWISPRGTLLDIHGDGSLWGLYFSGGNCLDGDSDAFHYIGYAESTDRMHWTVYNDIEHPIASINPITTTNQATGATVTVPANAPIIPTQPWFAERLYAPTATRIDATHLSMTFAGYGVQTPNNDLLEYRQIGNVVLTVSQALPAGVPNNINAH
jgi:hypothetical protein